MAMTICLWGTTMSKLTDIKNRIDQMDGGAFQNLCDAYLSYKGYKMFIRWGCMQYSLKCVL